MLAGDADAAARASQALLVWYERWRRDLPWRRRGDAYATWVAEVMLQQTRVEAVLPYYERFLERFPDVETLAAAAPEEVLAAWSGLGYYRRARHLHAAARQVAAAGAWPASAAQWRQLPGIGEYTAAAIASIAGGEVVAVLDGNVERVGSRLAASTADPKKAAARRDLAAVARALLDPARPGDSNQALMELGATVCRPRAPRCADCPLQAWCGGFAAGAPESFPRRPREPAATRVRRRVFVVKVRRRYLLARRGLASRQLAGFWELPWLDDPDAGAGGLSGEMGAALAAKYGGVWEIGEASGRVRHAITRRRFEIEIYAAAWRPEGVAETPAAEPTLGWFRREEIAALATSSLVRKVLATWLAAS
ncbi:MAG: NUDIX domain-containing protein [Acidobacteriota bacterium]|nr:NUDIX domain-containing protein [Acidobacteriota bacterium]